MDTKATLASPTFTGTVTAPTVNVTGVLTATNAVLKTPSIAGATLTGAISGGTFTNGSFAGTGTYITALDGGNITSGTISNAQIAATAAIADTKLATISTSGKVANSATTATSANTASAIVARDGSGNFTAGTITATLSGNASTATLASSVYASNVVNGGQLPIGTVAAATNAVAGPFLSYDGTNRNWNWNAGALTNLTASKIVGTITNSITTTNPVVSGGTFTGTTNANSVGTGFWLAPVGSASAPGLAGVGYTNTGLYWGGNGSSLYVTTNLTLAAGLAMGGRTISSANSLNMVNNSWITFLDSGGSSRNVFTFDSGNNLYLQGWSGTDMYLLPTSSSPTGVIIKSTGSVGVGTASPQYKLDIIGTGRMTGTNTFWFGGTAGAADGNVGLYNISSGRLLHTGNLENVGNMNVGFYGAGSIANLHVKGNGASGPILAIGSTGNSITSDFVQIQLNGTNKFTVDKNFTINQPGTITAAGTTGAQTINKPLGSVNLAAAATSLVVTNSAVGSATDTIVLLTVGSNDTTTKSCAAVVGMGQFTIYPNAAPTAETVVFFQVLKIK